MAKRNPVAGGFFLTAAILIGFAWGVAEGQAMAGVLAGTAVGVAIILIIWLVDRGRG
jgi:hypothetical protein